MHFCLSLSVGIWIHILLKLSNLPYLCASTSMYMDSGFQKLMFFSQNFQWQHFVNQVLACRFSSQPYLVFFECIKEEKGLLVMTSSLIQCKKVFLKIVKSTIFFLQRRFFKILKSLNNKNCTIRKFQPFWKVFWRRLCFLNSTRESRQLLLKCHTLKLFNWQ